MFGHYNELSPKVTSLKMLCNLWDSVKELVMVCATTKMTVSCQGSLLYKLLLLLPQKPLTLIQPKLGVRIIH